MQTALLKNEKKSHKNLQLCFFANRLSADYIHVYLGELKKNLILNTPRRANVTAVCATGEACVLHRWRSDAKPLSVLKPLLSCAMYDTTAFNFFGMDDKKKKKMIVWDIYLRSARLARSIGMPVTEVTTCLQPPLRHIFHPGFPRTHWKRPLLTRERDIIFIPVPQQIHCIFMIFNSASLLWLG